MALFFFFRQLFPVLFWAYILVCFAVTFYLPLTCVTVFCLPPVFLVLLLRVISPPTHTPVSHQSRQHCPVHCVSPPAPVHFSVLRPCVSSASPHVFLVFLICSLWFFLFVFFGFFWFAISCVFVFSFFLGLSFAWLLLLAFWISHWTSDSLLLVFNSLVSVFLCLGLLYI